MGLVGDGAQDGDIGKVLLSGPAGHELIDDDRREVVSPGQQCRVLHVELPLLLRWSLARHMGYARERHHEPIGAPQLDAKESNWIKHQGFLFQDTTSSPASLWGTSFSSQNPGSSRSSFFGGGSSGQSSGVGGGGQGGSMWTSGSSNSGGGQASSAWSSRGTGGEQCSSTWSSSSRGYRTDRLMQMD